MFTLVELLSDNMSWTQVKLAFLADCIFFGSLYWGYWRKRIKKEKEKNET
tara:strand:- start:8 stop:157 length:150 start_codon:yes stop_codon:yes gene_type:complete